MYSLSCTADSISPVRRDSCLRRARDPRQSLRQQSRMSFAFETTLSGKGYLSFLRRLKAEGHQVHIFLLSLRSVELALSRVRQRVLPRRMMFQRQSFDDASILQCKTSWGTIVG